MVEYKYHTKPITRTWEFPSTVIHRDGCAVFDGPAETDMNAMNHDFDAIDVTYTITCGSYKWQFFTTVSTNSLFKSSKYTDFAANGPEGYTIVDADTNTLEILCDQTTATFSLPDGAAVELLDDLRQLYELVKH